MGKEDKKSNNTSDEDKMSEVDVNSFLLIAKSIEKEPEF